MAFCSIAASVSRKGFFWRGIGEPAAGSGKAWMRASVSAITPSSSGRRGARPSMQIDDQRAARQAGTRLDHVVQTRRAAGRSEMAEGFGLRREARGCRGIAFMRIGDAREKAVGQAHMAVRRAGRGQRLQVGDGERRKRRPLAQRGEQSVIHVFRTARRPRAHASRETMRGPE